MSKFKFGDMVRHKETGSVFIVSDLEEDGGYIAAMEQESGCVYSVEMEKLEFIPHPDTVRLDYVGAKTAKAVGVEYFPEAFRKVVDKEMKGEAT